MIASSSTALSNLAYLIGVVVVAIVVGVAIWLRHRPPKSVDANMESFRRGLSALAPDSDVEARTAASSARSASYQPGQSSSVRPMPRSQVHVRVESARVGDPAAPPGPQGGQPG